MARHFSFRRESQTEFAKVFRTLGDRHSSWQAWADFVELTAISIFMPFGDPDDEKHKQREKEYLSIAKRYTSAELKVFAKLFAMTVEALEEEPEQDFLGELFMGLELSNRWKGQFFTPYHVCEFMAKIATDDVAARIDQRGWVGISDCCCGAGAMLIAARNELAFSDPPIGPLMFHQQTLFVAQDVDYTAGLMCYIQLSLLGCAGYVIIGDSLLRPSICLDGNAALPIETEGQDIWCMPMFHDQIWVWRQAAAKLDVLLRTSVSKNPSTPQEAAPVTADRPVEPKDLPPPEPEAAALGVTSTGQLTLF